MEFDYHSLKRSHHDMPGTLELIIISVILLALLLPLGAGFAIGIWFVFLKPKTACEPNSNSCPDSESDSEPKNTENSL